MGVNISGHKSPHNSSGGANQSGRKQDSWKSGQNYSQGRNNSYGRNNGQYNSYGRNNGQYNSYGRNNGQYNNQGGEGYVGSPYNFVSLPKTVYKYPQEKQTAHNEMSDKLFSGEVDYRITANTPIIVDDGTGHFRKDTEGNYAIPGSTIRGLIRNNVQILGLSSVWDDIDDYTLMYRHVAAGAEKESYNKVLGNKSVNFNNGKSSQNLSVLMNVKAGYIAQKDGKYVIYPTKLGMIKKELGSMNYYVLSERKIIENYLSSKNDHRNFDYPFFGDENKSILQHKFKSFNKSMNNGRLHYKGVENGDYAPYMYPVSYVIKNLKDVAAVDAPGKYPTKGYAVSSGKMQEKKAVYIIPEIDMTKESIPIPEKDILAFRIDYEKRKNTIRAQNRNHFFDLPKDGEAPKPVFYIQLNGRLYFGFTPRLRLFYDNPIKNGLGKDQRECQMDYGKVMFGYSNDAGSYKSKLSFSDAVLVKGGEKMGEQREILAEPKPTSYLDYLQQTGSKPVTYNGDFKLRGIKQYWLRDSVGMNEKAEAKPEGKSDKKSDNDQVASKFTPLGKGSTFTGKVRFQNLTEDELGLLLWSIRLNDNSHMNIGKAKAFGYGNVKVEITAARTMDFAKAYCSAGELELTPYRDVDVDAEIQYYKQYISEFLKRNIDNLPHIEEFFLMKAADKMPKKENIRYMKIDNREYQNRQRIQKALPTVKEVIKESEKSK